MANTKIFTLMLALALLSPGTSAAAGPAFSADLLLRSIQAIGPSSASACASLVQGNVGPQSAKAAPNDAGFPCAANLKSGYRPKIVMAAESNHFDPVLIPRRQSAFVKGAKGEYVLATELAAAGLSSEDTYAEILRRMGPLPGNADQSLIQGLENQRLAVIVSLLVVYNSVTDPQYILPPARLARLQMAKFQLAEVLQVNPEMKAIWERSGLTHSPDPQVAEIAKVMEDLSVMSPYDRMRATSQMNPGKSWFDLQASTRLFALLGRTALEYGAQEFAKERNPVPKAALNACLEMLDAGNLDQQRAAADTCKAKLAIGLRDRYISDATAKAYCEAVGAKRPLVLHLGADHVQGVRSDLRKRAEKSGIALDLQVIDWNRAPLPAGL